MSESNDTKATKAEAKIPNTSGPKGTLWEIPAKDDVTITRPGGEQVRVLAGGGYATHVLDVEGEFTATVDGEIVATAQVG